MLLKAEPAHDVATLDMEEHRPPSGSPRHVRISGPRRAMFARIMVCVIIALTIAMASVIYYRWATVREPSTSIAFQGDSSVSGARVTVKGKDQQWSAVLNAENGYTTPLLLEPGNYRITITHRKMVILDQDLTLARDWLISLPCRVKIQGAGPDQAELAIVGDHYGSVPLPEPAPQLTADKHFKTFAYLLPDHYQLTARHQERVIAQREFTVDRGKELQIDLSKPAPGSEDESD